MGSIVYRYGLRAPVEGQPIVREQLLLAHRYRNVLTEIERGRRVAVRAVMVQFGDIPTLEAAALAAKEQEQRCVAAVRRCRAATRSRSDTEAQRAALRLARIARKEAVKVWRDARKAIRSDPAVEAALDIIAERAGELRRSAREHCGVYWGTYQLVEGEARQAAKMPLYAGTQPSDPRFVRWSGEGAVSVQLMGGRAGSDLFGDTTDPDRQLQIAPVDERAWYAERRGDRRLHARTGLRLRVGSDEARQPIWAAWPMIMHRPLPPGATIKRVTVQLRRCGPREIWSADFTVTTQQKRQRLSTGTDAPHVCAIDVGWRQFRDQGLSIRVGAWADSAGQVGEVRLDQTVITGIRKADELRSLRDQRFADARTELRAWRAEHVLPDWLQRATVHLALWKSPARLAALVRRWATDRFPGDSAMFQRLEAWRYHDHHLWVWESSQRAKALRRRREGYRVWAAAMADQYDVFVLEQFDLRTFARRALPDAAAENQTARSNRHLVAVSELRSCLSNAIVARGKVEARLSAVNTTRQCHVCQHIAAFDAATEIMHMCPACHASWDQDDNAAKNLLHRWGERPSDAQIVGSARASKTSNEDEEVRENRWVRARRLGAARRARLASAREPMAMLP